MIKESDAVKTSLLVNNPQYSERNYVKSCMLLSIFYAGEEEEEEEKKITSKTV